MADIKIISDGGETKNAIALKSILDRQIPANSKGCILIAPSFTCFGSDVGDIDLVMAGQLSTNLTIPFAYQPIRQQCTIRNFVFTIEVKAVAPEDISLELNLLTVAQ